MSQMPTPTFVSTLLFRIELTFWKKGFIGSSKRSWRSWKNSLVVVFMHFESNIPSSIPVSVYLFHENAVIHSFSVNRLAHFIFWGKSMGENSSHEKFHNGIFPKRKISKWKNENDENFSPWLLVVADKNNLWSVGVANAFTVCQKSPWL